MNVLIVYPNGNALNPHSGAETRIWNLNYALTNLNFEVLVLHSLNSKGFEDNGIKYFEASDEKELDDIMPRMPHDRNKVRFFESKIRI